MSMLGRRASSSAELAPEPEPLPLLDADNPVELWRFDCLCEAGYDVREAVRIAQSGADLHRAIKLRRQGCAPELAARILL